jgi:hypothetical protein
MALSHRLKQTVYAERRLAMIRHFGRGATTVEVEVLGEKEHIHLMESRDSSYLQRTLSIGWNVENRKGLSHHLHAINRSSIIIQTVLVIH